MSQYSEGLSRMRPNMFCYAAKILFSNCTEMNPVGGTYSLCNAPAFYHPRKLSVLDNCILCSFCNMVGRCRE